MWAQLDRAVEQLSERFPAAAVLLADAAADILAFTGCPMAHWRQVWLNKEIRRTDIVLLVGAVFAEQHDERAVQRCYLAIGAVAPPAEPQLTTRGASCYRQQAERLRMALLLHHRAGSYVFHRS